MSWNGYNIAGWPHDAQQVEAFLGALVQLYPDVEPRTLRTSTGPFLSHAVAAASAAFGDHVIDATEMDIAYEYIEDGVVMGHAGWDAMTPDERIAYRSFVWPSLADCFIMRCGLTK